eukprot:GEMP01014136.1.p1 GENE.GEMP01014136.1~~GEMP01014136.1.p1  ORF type:complete len:844 (+),score=173.22 GEMP01014136.1:190-2721(+)
MADTRTQVYRELVGQLRGGPLSFEALKEKFVGNALWGKLYKVLSAPENSHVFCQIGQVVSLRPEYAKQIEDSEAAEYEESRVNNLWASYPIKTPKLNFPFQREIASQLHKLQALSGLEKICIEFPTPAHGGESSWHRFDEITGVYSRTGTHHNRPIFAKDEYSSRSDAPIGKGSTQIYFWDDEDEFMRGWWIAEEIGAEGFFAFNNAPQDSTSPVDLNTPWRSGGDGDDDPFVVRAVDAKYNVRVKDNKILLAAETRAAMACGEKAIDTIYKSVMDKYTLFAKTATAISGEKLSPSEFVFPEVQRGVYRVLLEHPAFTANPISKTVLDTIKTQAPEHEIIKTHPRGLLLFFMDAEHAAAALEKLHFFQLEGHFVKTTWAQQATTNRVDAVYSSPARRRTRKCHQFLKGACSRADCIYAHHVLKLELHPHNRIIVANLPPAWDLSRATSFFKAYAGFDYFAFQKSLSDAQLPRGIVTFQSVECALETLSRLAGRIVEQKVLECEWATDAFVPEKVLSFYSQPSKRFWKTRMCVDRLSGGHCEREQVSCPFAHTRDELRRIEKIDGEQPETLETTCLSGGSSAIIYIDSLPMPKRPQLAPSVEHRELFFKVDSSIADDGWKELAQTALKTGKIWFLPRAGYVLFESHAAAETALAEACIAGMRVAWSESERLRTRTYKRDLLDDIEKELPHVAEKSGATVELRTKPFVAFEVKGPSMDYVELCSTFLASSLSAAHESISNTTSLLISGFPPNFTQKRFNMMTLPYKPILSEFFEQTGLVVLSGQKAKEAKEALQGFEIQQGYQLNIEIVRNGYRLRQRQKRAHGSDTRAPENALIPAHKVAKKAR